MRKKIAAFGNKGAMHIYIAKRDGFNIGDEIELVSPKETQPQITEERVRTIVQDEIQKAKGGY